MANFCNLKVNSTEYWMWDKRIQTSVSNSTPSGAVGDVYFKAENVIAKSGNWYYVTRPDGIKECWAAIPFSNCAVTTGWNGSYAGDLCGSGKPWGTSWDSSTTYCKFPITFSSIPSVTVGSYPTNGDHWIYISSDASTTRGPAVSLGRAASGTCSGVITMHAIGI